MKKKILNSKMINMNFFNSRYSKHKIEAQIEIHCSKWSRKQNIFVNIHSYWTSILKIDHSFYSVNMIK